MRRPSSLFSIAFALGVTILAPAADAQPTKINNCQTISNPGSYVLTDNLSANADCLVITADFVTINLAGFTISGGGAGFGIAASPGSGQRLRGIAVRNGSITNFFFGVDLASADGSIVEGLRLSGNSEGIAAVNAIVKGNTVTGFDFFGISASASVITGNNASFSNNVSGADGFVSGGGTVIGNTAMNNGNAGFRVFCPVNLTDNTAVGNHPNLVLNGNGCNNTNNVAP